MFELMYKIVFCEMHHFGTFWFGNNTLKNWTNVLWKSVTYNSPWENINVLKSRPKCFTNFPCDLLIVITKTTFTRNCFLVNLKGIIDVVGCKMILGMNVVSPAWFPINIHASITWLFRHVTMNHEPLHNPHFGAIFHNIIGHPTLRWSFVGDFNLENLKNQGIQ